VHLLLGSLARPLTLCILLREHVHTIQRQLPSALRQSLHLYMLEDGAADERGRTGGERETSSNKSMKTEKTLASAAEDSKEERIKLQIPVCLHTAAFPLTVLYL
jgi:hypothetical protein